MSCIVHDAVYLWTETKSNESDNHTDVGSSVATHLKESASSTSLMSKGVNSANGSQHDSMFRNASTGDLGGHADVTGSSTVLPRHSISGLQTRMRSQPVTAAEYGTGDEDKASDGDLMNCLLRAAGTSACGGSSDGSGLALRRKRRSNATDLETGIRERTSSPVCFDVVGDLGQRTAGRRRSLPTPHLTVHDVAASGCLMKPLRGTDDSAQCSGLQPFSDAAADSTTAGVRAECLSDIDESFSTTASSISEAPDVSRTVNKSTKDSVTDSDKTTAADNVNISEDKETFGNTTDEQKSVEDTFTSARVSGSKNVDAVQQDVSKTGGSSTDSILRQTRSTADVDITETWSSSWLPRRSQSLRLYRLRERSAARGELESQQLDTNVQEFQTRAAPEREALRNRLRKLSLIYADSDETSRTWPASRRPCADGEDGHATPTTVPGIPLLCSKDVVSASSSTSTLQLKYDTDSLSSQKDEGFETASISSDVYLSSSQRSSMCDCDAAVTTMSTLERRTDPTATKTTDGTAQPQPETLPPPPASLLSGSEEVDGSTVCFNGENSVTRSSEGLVLLEGEVKSADIDTQQQPQSDASLSAVSTASVSEKRPSQANTESSRKGSQGSVRQKAQTVGTQAKIVPRPAPATPRRGSSLVPSSTSRNVGATRATTAATSNHATGRTPTAAKQTIRPSSGTGPTVSTPARPVAFQRSSSQRVADSRKLTPCSRAAPPPLSSSSATAFVRQSQTRATIAAPVLRTNKRAAAEARKMKAATATTSAASTSVVHGNDSPSSRTISATTSTSTISSVVSRPQRGRYRTSSSGSCSSTTSAGTGPKLTSFRAISSATTTVSRPPSTSLNVPCTSVKKPDRGIASSLLKTPSSLRSSTQQPPNSRLRAPVLNKKPSK